jgi:hypothetical protein
MGSPTTPNPTIHEATLGESKSVEWAAEIEFAAAVTRRRAGGDVVVRGDDGRINRDLARRIEVTVGEYIEHPAHRTFAGHCSLPHFQQKVPPPAGHCFFEKPGEKSRRKK